jgi:hypothetical protein
MSHVHFQFSENKRFENLKTVSTKSDAPSSLPAFLSAAFRHCIALYILFVSLLLKMNTIDDYCLSTFQVEYSTLSLEQKFEIHKRWLEEKRIAAPGK